METEERIRYAIEHTELVRMPRQALATFGISDIRYYLLTQPVYAEICEGPAETVVREGRVIAERPRIVTPYYLINLFQGFEHGREYAEYVLRTFGANEPGLLYRYRNEPAAMNILSSPMESVIENISHEIDSCGDPLTTIIKGVDELWDISLMKFIHDITRESLGSNVMEMGRHGMLGMERGIPRHARYLIEQLFREAAGERSRISELETELRRWGLFGEYEDRFLDLFRRR